ncbi:MAG: bifunctional hydroxymethylpyrimidine kinase/phosphomethylpyrimidine kinase [Thermofilum sp.]|nr:bifunctional hydroxymethylpyrimidine kinase/phosphomethylpyrimidine kinase [Thermofilum sp.]
MFGRKVPVAMTIAGSDSGGGAGIQADLKTFAALGVHGTVALTAVTAQNTFSVTAIQEISLDVIEKQIDAVYEDMGIDAAKTGMLYKPEVIELVSRKVREYGFPLVVDPVMVAKSGAQLLRPEAVDALREKLIPVAKVVTPNIPEAEILAGMSIKSVEDMESAAKAISKLGPECVVVKGGHASSADLAVDVVYTQGRVHRILKPRIPRKTTHGTGCTFSAAIAAELAKGAELLEAVRVAKEFVHLAIEFGLEIGRGHGPVNPMAYLYREASRYRALREVREAARILEESPAAVELVPEVGINVAEAIPYAVGVEDVVGIPGRMRNCLGRLKAGDAPEFGCSSHLARYLLKVRELGGEFNAAINVRFSEEIIHLLKERGFVVSSYDRREEPREVKEREGATIPWGVEEAVKRAGRIPDAIYHLGDWGKEPMIVIFGRSARELAELVAELSKEIKARSVRR